MKIRVEKGELAIEVEVANSTFNETKKLLGELMDFLRRGYMEIPDEG